MAEKQFDNELRGALFRNDRKKTDKHPDFTGNVQVEGVEYWMSAWTKQGAKGSFLSVSLQLKQPRGAADDILDPATQHRQSTPARQQEPAHVPGKSSFNSPGDIDDDIPF